MILKLSRTLLQLGMKNPHLIRHCAIIAKKELSPSSSKLTKIYEVSPRCTLNGFLSYKTILLPHDVNNTSESDKLIMKCPREITVNQIGTSVNLTTSRDSYDDTTVCELHVPLKANINLTAIGDVKVGDLQGDGVRVFSEIGSVTLGNLKCGEISAGSNDKDILVEGDIEAGKVELMCRKTGSIKAQKIKCHGLKLDTNEGNISMTACYSKNAYFLTKTGHIDLKNVHNRCRIDTFKKGTIKMVGFEGALEVSLQNGKADLQIQKLYDDSDIIIREEGEMTLRIPLELLDHAEILIWSKGCYVDDEIPNTEDEMKDLTTIRKEGAKVEHVLRVRCLKATCNVRLASWVDMMRKAFEDKRSDEQSVQNMKQQVN